MKKIFLSLCFLLGLLCMHASAQVLFDHQDGAVTATAQIVNKNSKEQNVLLVLCAQPKAGGKARYAMGSAVVSTQSKGVVTAGPLDYEGEREDYQFTAFLWDGWKTMIPLAEKSVDGAQKETPVYSAWYDGLTEIINFNPDQEGNQGEWLVSGSGIMSYNNAKAYYSNTAGAKAVFPIQVKYWMEYDVYYYVPSLNVGDSRATYEIETYQGIKSGVLDLTQETGFIKVGTFWFSRVPEYRFTISRSGDYLRCGTLMVVPKGTAIDQEVVGENTTLASYFPVNGDILITAAQEHASVTADVPADRPFLFEIALSKLASLKHSFPQGDFTVSTQGGKLRLDYASLDPAAIAATLGVSQQDVTIRGYLGQTQRSQEANVQLAQTGTSCVTEPMIFKLEAVGGGQEMDLAPVAKGGFLAFPSPKLTVVDLSGGTAAVTAREIQPVAYDQPAVIWAALNQSGPLYLFDENPEVRRLENGETEGTRQAFTDALYHASGLEPPLQTADTLTFEDAAVIVADYLAQTGRQVQTGLPQGELAASFGDWNQIAPEKRDAVFHLAEADLIRGDGSTLLSPQSALAGAEAARLIYGAVNLKQFESPLLSQEWELVFHDEFNGTGMDWTVWQSANGPFSHIASSRYPENVEVKEGLARLIAKKETRDGQDWTTASVWTKEQYTYGYFEAKYKYPNCNTPNYNIAFWLFKTMKPGQYTPRYQELDINEGRMPNLIQTGLWGGSADGATRWNQYRNFKMPYDFRNEYHVYGFEWNEQELIWYFDGREIRREPNTETFQPMQVYLSTAIMKEATEEELLPDVDGSAMEVEYVRVYQKKRN